MDLLHCQIKVFHLSLGFYIVLERVALRMLRMTIGLFDVQKFYYLLSGSIPSLPNVIFEYFSIRSIQSSSKEMVRKHY